MCSCARIGLPAATRPTSGSESCARLGSGRLNCLPRAWFSARSVSDCSRMPRDVPPTSSITPLRASACRCSSAALAELKPSSLAISARVGGAPVRSIALCTRSRICCWRSVSFGHLVHAAPPAWSEPQADWLNLHPVLYFHPVREKCKAPVPHRRRPRHRRHDRRHRGLARRQRRLRRAARVGVDALVAAAAGAGRRRGRDASRSRSSTARTWTSPPGSALAQRVAAPSRRAPEVAGVVVTHGTDTLEETAYFLHASCSRRPSRWC